MNILVCPLRQTLLAAMLLLTWLVSPFCVQGNPIVGPVAPSGATIGPSGSQLTINQTSPFAFINWQSFNINSGETTTFNQPSATSVAWNQINDSSASSINGNLNANGYVILQNQNGFTIGGSAVINAHGLVMTTASTPALNLSSGGAWAFDAPPPTIRIVNSGQINITGGGSVYLIASDIENDGTISAPGGKIGLYAGQHVLVSMSPDGRGLNAQVTLPEGSVDNKGNLKADAGSIILQAAQVVNQGGLIQANSVQNVNGTIELVASDSLNLGAGSQITARGDPSAASASPGGFVVLNAGNNTFTDTSGSTISVSGTAGGQDGIVEIFGNGVTTGSLHSSIGNHYALLINPYDVTLSTSATDASSSNPTLNVGDLSVYTQILLGALDNIELSTAWNLANPGSPATLSLSAGNNLLVDDNSGISAGKNWTVSLNAGTGLNLGAASAVSADNLILGVPAITSANGNVNLQALDYIELSSLLTLADPGSAATLNLNAGRNIIVDDSSGISAGKNWTVNLNAGTGLNLGAASGISADKLVLDVPAITSVDGNANFQALNDIELSSLLTLADPGSAAALNLNAGRNIIVDGGSGISAGKNWTVNLTGKGLNLGVASGISADNLNLGIGSITAAGGNAKFEALNDIELDALLTLANSGAAATLTLNAGNDITLNNSITAGNNWSVNMTAGAQLPLGSLPTSGNDGIYLNNGSVIQTQNGNINLSAANEVIINGGGAIRTMNDGNIAVTATYGNVNAGDNSSGYVFQSKVSAPYKVSPNLGGISTAAGGNVSITAGGDVISYFPSVTDISGAGKQSAIDGGTGAFGSLAGNVTIVAGGNVYGNYIEANGTGSITALNGNVGDPNDKVHHVFALNLIKGSWTVNAPNGSISLQEVRNPNGVFNIQGVNANVFDYAPDAAVTLDAGNAVEIWGYDSAGYSDSVPRFGSAAVPVVLPPILNVLTGAGGFTIDHDLTLFQSPVADLNITTTAGGNFTGIFQPVEGSYPKLYMSDSASSKWSTANTMKFSNTDVAARPYELDNPNYGLAVINVSGNLEYVNIYTVKETQITVGGDMINAGFAGQNLHAGDVTSITVGGQIFYTPLYSFEPLNGALQPDIPSTDVPIGNVNFSALSSVLNKFFYLLVDPTVAADVTLPSGTTYAVLNNVLYPGLFLGRNDNGTFNGFTAGLGYNPTTHTLSFKGPMSPDTESYLESGPFYVIRLNPSTGLPVTDSSGHLVLDPVSLADAAIIATLYNNSQNTTTTTAYGLQIGGPGHFNVTAGSISLGDSFGIESWGIAGPQNLAEGYLNYNNPLVAVTPAGGGASITVTTLNNDTVDPVTGALLPSLDMVSSRIASWYGGNVTVISGGGMDLGTQEVVPELAVLAYGIFSIDMNPGLTGHGNVTVEAQNDINIQGSRIAAFNGGNVKVTSDGGSVNVGSGGNTFSDVKMMYVDPATGQIAEPRLYQIFGSGIVAESLPSSLLAFGQPSSYGGNTPPPGNITIKAYKDIIASTAGILQIALGGSTAGGPFIKLDAGGDIDLGGSGVIGGTIDANAGGNISGLIISRQNANINAAANFNGVVLAGGTANLSASSAEGVVIGVGGINSTVGASGSLTLLSQNVSAGGSQVGSTFATATASSSTQAAAASSSNDATQQASGSGNDNQDDQKKKKQAPQIRRIGRVTVLLSSAVPER